MNLINLSWLKLEKKLPPANPNMTVSNVIYQKLESVLIL